MLPPLESDSFSHCPGFLYSRRGWLLCKHLAIKVVQDRIDTYAAVFSRIYYTCTGTNVRFDIDFVQGILRLAESHCGMCTICKVPQSNISRYSFDCSSCADFDCTPRRLKCLTPCIIIYKNFNQTHLSIHTFNTHTRIRYRYIYTLPKTSNVSDTELCIQSTRNCAVKVPGTVQSKYLQQTGTSQIARVW